MFGSTYPGSQYIVQKSTYVKDGVSNEIFETERMQRSILIYNVINRSKEYSVMMFLEMYSLLSR